MTGGPTGKLAGERLKKWGAYKVKTWPGPRKDWADAKCHGARCRKLQAAALALIPTAGNVV